MRFVLDVGFGFDAVFAFVIDGEAMSLLHFLFGIECRVVEILQADVQTESHVDMVRQMEAHTGSQHHRIQIIGHSGDVGFFDAGFRVEFQEGIQQGVDDVVGGGSPNQGVCAVVDGRDIARVGVEAQRNVDFRQVRGSDKASREDDLVGGECLRRTVVHVPDVTDSGSVAGFSGRNGHLQKQCHLERIALFQEGRADFGPQFQIAETCSPEFCRPRHSIVDMVVVVGHRKADIQEGKQADCRIQVEIKGWGIFGHCVGFSVYGINTAAGHCPAVESSAHSQTGTDSPLTQCPSVLLMKPIASAF